MYERTYHNRVLKTEGEMPARKKRVSRRRKILTAIIAAAVVVCATVFVVVARMPRMQIKTVEIEGTNVADPSDVSTFVMNQLQGRILYVLPRTSIMLAPTRRIERAIRDAFPRFETVDVDRAGVSGLQIEVTEYGGVYLWCLDEEQCFFMDKNGIVFAPAPYFSGSAYPKIIVGERGELPFKPITDEALSFVVLVIDRLHDIAIDSTAFHFVTPHNVEVSFAHHAGTAKIHFDPTLDTETSLEALFTALRTQPLANKFYDQTKILQYIDLRFENKVVYKFL